MTTLCRAYTSAADADAAVDRLLSAGVTAAEIAVLMSEELHDAREAPVGGFAGTTSPTAETVGSYDGAAHASRDAMGAFAGDADDQRRGAFADVDRETVTTYAGDVTRMRIASHHDLERMLRDAGLDAAAAKADVAALHAGRILVLVRDAMAPEGAAAVLDARV